ncbi:PREDICTED: protein cortex isoform X2 [Wasmannia auropunctata]|uniref:protein cortex isoform X2 n=1 Tax=Wasmannia auropunctata TaxID=64793 RepID=UPI0005EF3C90|nr:PREDICTED: protein cortex isoform X2 [Wasmannia auropunctata]
MNRFLLDLQNIDWQNQGIANDTPLRGDYPRLRRTTELLDGTKSIIPRKWLLSSTPQKAIDEEPEQSDAQKFRHPNCIKIKTFPLISKQIYSGDRFLPCRRGYSFEMAHYLLRKNDKVENTHIIDVCKEVDSLDVTYRRKALRAMIIERVLMPELDQDKILRFSGSMVRPRNPPRPEYEEKKGSWKCAPRKRSLIGSADKMLSIPDRFPDSLSNNSKAVDWSCNDMIAVTDYDRLNIYDNNSEKVSSYRANTDTDSVEITDIKWGDDGNKLIMSVYIPIAHISTLTMYDLKKEKILWEVTCECWSLFAEAGCVMRCICWSARDRQIVTGCNSKISMFDSGTGKFLYSKHQHDSDILTLSFSPNFKHLVSTAQDRLVRVFAWPELTPCFNIRFYKPIKAVAWHPQVPDLLCLGGRKNGSLSLWNVNKCAMMAHVRPKFNGCVENLAWNKLSGELIVHWTYKEGDNKYTIVAVLASFNRIVDVLPLDKETQLSFLKFNATHERLITFCSNNVCSIWNFFGNEKSFQGQCTRHCSSSQRRQGVMVHNPIR